MYNTPTLNQNEVDPNNYLDTLHHLSDSMGDTITLNQALKIADRLEEETQKILDRGIPEDSYSMDKEWDQIIKEVVG
jgi:hypothetical protein